MKTLSNRTLSLVIYPQQDVGSVLFNSSPNFYSGEIFRIHEYLQKLSGWRLEYTVCPEIGFFSANQSHNGTHFDGALGMLERGEADMLVNKAVNSPEREKHFHFLRPWLFDNRKDIYVVAAASRKDTLQIELGLSPIMAQFPLAVWLMFFFILFVLRLAMRIRLEGKMVWWGNFV